MDKDVAKWDIFWRDRKEKFFQPQPDDWYKLVWKIGCEYWSDIFNKFGKGKKMLECGAGSAKLSLYMARQGYDCTMVDNSLEGLNVGRSRFEQEGLAGKFILGDVTRMHFGDETFDIVTSGGLLQHFRDIKPPTAEMVRVLKRGGLCTAVVIPKKFSCQTIGDMEFFLVRFAKKLLKGRFKGIISESKNRFPFYVNSLSLKEYVAVFELAGLGGIAATGLSPFPSLALPKELHRIYARFLKAMIPLWKRFDRSHSKITEIWGASFGIHGFKK
jgi:ubiquinone/menaquinone biosynthesis C-methylase UbiE